MPYVRKWGELKKNCVTCGVEFVLKSGSQIYCTRKCRRVEYRKEGSHESTTAQYALISGNWEKYLRRLLARSFNRSGLTVEDCVSMLKKQNYRCALSGVPLTCTLVKGEVSKTNVSLDRVDPKGAYVKENVQLVCSVLNKFRIDTPLDEFIEWCKKVANHAVCK
jgi:hypothetical protein